MALLSKLKSLLGIGGGADDDRRTETTVTVEHAPDEAVDTSTDEPTDTEPASTGSESGSVVADEAEAGDAAHDESAAVANAETTADAPSDAPETVAADDAESASDNGEPDAVAASDNTDSDDDEPLDSIKGIGPAYSERLHDAGITSIAELAEGDAEAIGEAINVSPKTVSNWIDRAVEQ